MRLAEGLASFRKPFSPRRSRRDDPLGEGFTNADAVMGHFDFDPVTKAGLRLRPDARQLVVVETKIYSGLRQSTPRLTIRRPATLHAWQQQFIRPVFKSMA